MRLTCNMVKMPVAYTCTVRTMLTEQRPWKSHGSFMILPIIVNGLMHTYVLRMYVCTYAHKAMHVYCMPVCVLCVCVCVCVCVLFVWCVCVCVCVCVCSPLCSVHMFYALQTSIPPWSHSLPDVFTVQPETHLTLLALHSSHPVSQCMPAVPVLTTGALLSLLPNAEADYDPLRMLHALEQAWPYCEWTTLCCVVYIKRIRRQLC